MEKFQEDFCCFVVFNIDRWDFHLSLDPSDFLKCKSKIVHCYFQLRVEAVFKNILLYQIFEGFCHLKCNFYIYCLSAPQINGVVSI